MNIYHEFKIIIIGDSNVGKTTMIYNLLGKKNLNINQTIGVDFSIKNYKIKQKDKNISVKLQIWDTSGSERYKNISKNYYLNCDIVIIMFDLTDKKTFDNIPKWIDNIYEFKPKNIIIVGNKKNIFKSTSIDIINDNIINYKNDFVDFVEKKYISDEIIFDFALKNNLDYFKISSVNHNNVNKLFDKIQNFLLNKIYSDIDVKNLKQFFMKPNIEKYPLDHQNEIKCNNFIIDKKKEKNDNMFKDFICC